MTGPNAHALFSPSSASKWMRCAGSLAMEVGKPNKTSESAEEGTAAHELASWALTDGVYWTLAYLGRITTNKWEVTEEMCEKVQVYVDAIRARIKEYYLAGAVDVTVLVENLVDISDVVGVPDQFGTSDVIILVQWADGTYLIDVCDLKFGYRLVSALENEQMMTYALGAYNQYAALGTFTRARMAIFQPNRDAESDWECSIEDLLKFQERIKAAANEAQGIMVNWKGMNQVDRAAVLTPGEKQCQWCKAKATCPALRNFVEEAIECDFQDLTNEHSATQAIPDDPAGFVAKNPDMEERMGELLAMLRSKIPLIDMFCKGVLSASDAFVLDGGTMPGWKVVQGKKGNRKWIDANDAEGVMKKMRLPSDDMYSKKVISPTAAERLLAKDSPRRWKTLNELVTQSEGQPAVVEISDKRPPLVIQSPENDFVAVNDGDDLA